MKGILANRGFRFESGAVIEILDIPSVRERVVPISLEDYHAMIASGRFEDRSVELLEGIIVDKMSKTELHLFLVVLLEELLTRVCANKKLWVRKEDPIVIGNSEPEPDLSVVEGTFRDYRDAKPTSAKLVIEVAISSLARDQAKSAIYARADVPEYWIVKPESHSVEVHREPDRELGYTQVVEISFKERLSSTAIPEFGICFADELAE